MYEQNELFDFDELFDADQSPIENLHIVTTALHYEQNELIELKKMCKVLIKHYWGENYKEGNINDLILKIFRNEYKKIIQGETTDRPTGQQP